MPKEYMMSHHQTEAFKPDEVAARAQMANTMRELWAIKVMKKVSKVQSECMRRSIESLKNGDTETVQVLSQEAYKEIA